MVLACSLKLIWCCLVPSVCSDGDEGSDKTYTTTLLGGSKGKSRYLLKWSARTVPKRAAGVFENVFPGSHI